MERPKSELGGWVRLRWLGAGGNGVVYEVVRDAAKGAQKTPRERERDEQRLARFRDEIEVIARCQDIPGVLPLLDSSVGQGAAKDEPMWMVTKLAQAISAVVDTRTSLAAIVAMFRDLATTLAEMHRRDIAHRDIKPSNLFVLDGRAVVGDFGLAHFADKSAKTEVGDKVGPVYYIAPEMLNDAVRADGKAADVYSLAKTLWVLATGQTYPLPGHHRFGEAVFSLATYNGEPRSGALDRLLDACTQTSPAHRPSMESVAAELDAWLSIQQSGPEPVRSADSLDLRAVAPLFINVRQRIDAANEKARAQQREREATGLRIRERFRAMAVEATAALNEANLQAGLNIDNVHWGFQIDAAVPYDPAADWAVIPERSVLECSVAVHEFLDDGRVTVNAFHRHTRRTSNSFRGDFLWQRRATFLAGGTGETQCLNEIEAEFRKAFRPAVLAVLSHAGVIPKEVPPSGRTD